MKGRLRRDTARSNRAQHDVSFAMYAEVWPW